LGIERTGWGGGKLGIRGEGDEKAGEWVVAEGA